MVRRSHEVRFLLTHQSGTEFADGFVVARESIFPALAFRYIGFQIEPRTALTQFAGRLSMLARSKSLHLCVRTCVVMAGKTLSSQDASRVKISVKRCSQDVDHTWSAASHGVAGGVNLASPQWSGISAVF